MSDELDIEGIISSYEQFIDIAIDNSLSPRETAQSAMIAIAHASLQSRLPYEGFLDAVKELVDQYKQQWPFG